MNKFVQTLIIIFTVTLFILGSSPIQADSGVGIMPGKIEVNEPLYPGGRYNLPVVQVFNTGAQASRYEVVVSGMEKQKELQPPEGLVIISPQSFFLEPKANQVISLSLSVPVKAEPGDYLAYIEARPVSQNTAGTHIGAAVATKLYFTVKPSSTWAGLLTYTGSFFKRHALPVYIAAGLVILALLGWTYKRYLKLDIKIKLTRK